MTESLIAGLVPLGGWILTYLLHSTLMLGSVWLVARSGAVTRPGMLDVLWKAALVGGVVTSISAVARPRETAVFVEARTVVVQDTEDTTVEALHLGGSGPVRAGGAGLVDRSVLPGKAVLPGGAVLPGWLALAWMLVAVAGVGRTLAGRWRLRDGSGAVAPAGTRAQRALRMVAEGTGIPVRLRVSDSVTSPCVVGRTVLLSARSEAELSEAELQAVLAHEIAHVARRDGAWMLAVEVLVALFWLQPLNRVARAATKETAELVCDDWAVSRIRNPMELARSITRVAEWSVPGRPLLGVPMARRGEGSLAGRVRRIVQGRSLPAGEGRIRGAAAVCLLFAGGFLIPPVPVAREVHAIAVRGGAELEWTVDSPVEGSRATIVLRRFPGGVLHEGGS